jgi:hypothetical protein
VGEEMPAELAALLPGYDSWPYGHTVGPDARVAALTLAQRSARLLEWLPEMEREGWMTVERRKYYETVVRTKGFGALATDIDTDLGAGRITTEVRSIVLGLLPRHPTP